MHCSVIHQSSYFGHITQYGDEKGAVANRGFTKMKRNLGDCCYYQCSLGTGQNLLITQNI